MATAKNDVVGRLVDAINTSGKKFKDIDKASILDFLNRERIPKDKWESIYKQLQDMYIPKAQKEDRKNISSVVDYSDSSHNEVKVRQPRKSVFGEITKLAG